jgi:hypothetical protein
MFGKAIVQSQKVLEARLYNLGPNIFIISQGYSSVPKVFYSQGYSSGPKIFLDKAIV